MWMCIFFFLVIIFNLFILPVISMMEILCIFSKPHFHIWNLIIFHYCPGYPLKIEIKKVSYCVYTLIIMNSFVPPLRRYDRMAECRMDNKRENWKIQPWGMSNNHIFFLCPHWKIDYQHIHPLFNSQFNNSIFCVIHFLYEEKIQKYKKIKNKNIHMMEIFFVNAERTLSEWVREKMKF